TDGLAVSMPRRHAFGDCGPELAELRALVEETDCAGFHAGTAILGVRVVGEDDERDFRRYRMHGSQDVDSGAADQLEIQDDAVRPRLADSRHRFGRRFRFTDDA